MVKSLTSISIRNMKPEEVRKEYPDGGCRGLYVVVQPNSGQKSFAVRCRVNGKPAKITLGKFVFDDPAAKGKTNPKIGDALTLAAARKFAADMMHQIAGGGDPVASKRLGKEQEDRRREDTFRSVAERYMKREAGMKLGTDGNASFDESKLRTGHERWLMLQRSAFPTLGSRPIAEIKKSDIIKLLDRLADGELKDHNGKKIKGGDVAADRMLAVIRKIFSWHASREDDFRSPIVTGMNRVKASEQARKRVLTDPELRAIWTTASQLEGAFPSFLRFLLLTGARRAEASEMTWEEVSSNGDWLLPASRNKVKRDLVRPLSQAAQAVLAAQPKIGEFVFSSDGRTSIAGYSRHKKRFDAAVLEKLRKQDPEAGPLDNWTLHDCRRSARTWLSRAGVNADIAEQCLGHVLAGVRGVYDRHEFYDEKKRAFEMLAQQIAAIVDPTPTNVLPFPQAAGGKDARPE
jgi:integrase